MDKLLETLTAIGDTGRNEDGSYTRLGYSREYFAAVDVVKCQMEELGLQTQVDAAGNLHGVLPGTEAGLKNILLGSHLDTVPSGGLYDGAYGVAGALAVVRRLKMQNIKLRHPLEIYGFNGEEAGPMGLTFGSSVLTGLMDYEQPGLTEKLAVYGHTPAELKYCRRDFARDKCYLELHIEQGGVLEDQQLQIGVVSGIVGIASYKVTAVGKSNHAGTTLMAGRRDALVAMSQLIVEADRLCRALDENLVLTFGTSKCWPGASNVIPGKAECCLEMRHLDKSKTDQLFLAVQEAARKITTAQFTFELVNYDAPVACDAHLMEVIAAAAGKTGSCFKLMPSGAGHDAALMAQRVPAAMIFVPSKGGLSHCVEEWTSPKDLEQGVVVLTETVQMLDKED